MTSSRSTICKGCWQHMHVPIPIRGPLAIAARLFGVRISRMHPDLCTVCETMFTRVKRRKQIVVPATVLFADLRGYTTMSQSTASDDVTDMLHGFADQCAEAIWERDGVVNKFVGDAILAIFNFPIVRPDHVQQSVLAAQEIQRRWAERRENTARPGAAAIGLGIGIHTGNASIGEIGTAYKDFTIIGPVVNIASRIQGEARAGEIVASHEVYTQVAEMFPNSPSRECQVKGIDQPVTVHRLTT